ncbi:DUF1203 domain-containing protein [Gallaecimonas xiamenensis]|uniref:DUF1203 domain-containing protein n=1 Tax=Gallaecimonas xiamenensis 3-C-1 TaxID=745411 RepID=K2IWK7_9GAMM|nr:DUF1203 domain-containing protein [Gallaecimonas xiamenensis]EKE67258.1 hypothetical protein B3C1_18969 [Gallaecimonas xiamenensis 3-C-1]
MSRFILKGLAEAQFADLFTLDDQQLAARQMRRLVADSPNGYPCRISLDDAEPGDEVLALPYQHQGGDSPYRASGPIFVRQGARQAELKAGEVPPYIGKRLVSVRGYDQSHYIIRAAVCPGAELAPLLEDFFADPALAYVQLHTASRGCYLCQAERAQP